MKKIILALVLSLGLLNCTSQTKTEQMEEIINKVANSVTTYEDRPVYGVQVNKSGCKMVLEIDESVDYRFTDNRGESMMLPLNIMLLKSGKQTAIIKVYPKEGDSLLSKNAYVNLRFTLAPDKKSGLNEYKTIATFSLPENIGTLELPYYEAKVSFDVNVPFDHSIELAQAKDLKAMPNIEEMVVEKYNQLRDICLDLDNIGYLNERIHSAMVVYNNLYDVSKEDIKKGYEVLDALTDPVLYNRKILPIKNYTLQYYADGKIIALWQKNHNPMLYIKGNYKYTDGDEAYLEGGDPVFLYIPEGSNELKIW